MGLKETLTDLGMKGMNVVHRAVLTASGGRLLTAPFGMATVELHTTGRTTGRRRSTLLTAPVQEDGRVVLVASKGGDDRNPLWYENLRADPDVELTIGGVTTPMRARTADAAERAELWPRITQAYEGYAGYQRRTAREIPVVICEPR